MIPERQAAAPETVFGMHPFRLTADLLTVSRLPLGGLIWLRPDSMGLMLGVMLAAGLTDVLDGWFARRAGPADEHRRMGAWLDPVCDKLFLASILTLLWHAHDTPLLLLAMIATRDLLQLPVYAGMGAVPGLPTARRYDFSSIGISKATTVLQFLAICAILLWPPGVWPLAAATALLGLISAARYWQRLHAAPHE